MKRRVLGIMIVALLAMAMLPSCQGDDENVEKQERLIGLYLEKYELPYTVEQGVYKSLVHRVANADELPAAQLGDSLVFRFAGYVFNGAPTYLFYTNNRYLIEGDTILNTEYWSFEPKRVKLGDGSIIKGLEIPLLNSKAGDSLLVFLTSELGFGNESMGVVPENSAMMYVLNVDEVIK